MIKSAVMAKELHASIIASYFSNWLGIAVEQMDMPGVNAVYSKLRNSAMRGYSKAIELMLFKRKETVIVSYGDGYKPYIDDIVSIIESASDFKAILEQYCKRAFMEQRKYAFSSLPEHSPTRDVVMLNEEQYSDFFNFHCELHPAGNQEDWLYPYYHRLVVQGLIFGTFIEGKLVCANDAPDMPFMSDRIVEPGINTLAAYQRQGHATAVCARFISKVLKDGKVPIWSCSKKNIASDGLARKLGFEVYAEILSI